MLEHIYSKGYNGFGSSKLKRLLCFFTIHIWEGLEQVEVGSLTIIKERCVDCCRVEITVLIDWNKKEK